MPSLKRLDLVPSTVVLHTHTPHGASSCIHETMHLIELQYRQHRPPPQCWASLTSECRHCRAILFSCSSSVVRSRMRGC